MHSFVLIMPKKSPYPDISIPDTSFQEFVFTTIEQFGNDVAITDNATGESITYREIYAQSKRLSAALYQRGLRKGDVVGICASSCPQYVPILLATGLCGATLATCNPEYRFGEILQQFRQSKPILVFTHVRLLDCIKRVSQELTEIKYIFTLEKSLECDSFAQLIERSEEVVVEDFPCVSINPKKDVLMMPYSSGTSGLPKCVMHTHASCVAMAKIYNKHFHLFRTSVFYSERPMFNISGLLGILISLASGCHLVSDTEYDLNRICAAIETYKVTHTFLTAPLVIAMSKNSDMLDQYDLSSLLIALTGGDSNPSGMMTKIGNKLNASIAQEYSMTECVIAVPDPFVHDPESSGMILSNTEVKVVDILTGKELEDNQSGEILVKGPQRTIGYYKNPEATARTIDRDGWMHTGDVGRYNKDGMMFITGRIKEIIKHGSFQVPPAEIEEVLLSHPKISDVGVIGIPDPEAGEVPRALVVRKDESLTKEDVTKHVKNRLADYKHLRGGVQFVDSIPKSNHGKILRQELKKMVKIA